ncbi:MAG TPA: endonuclease I, partial [Chryseobacterium sp.]|nr:endonuclease I [Chryseobacterium sp.]
MKRILLLCFLLPALVFSQIPAGYYDGTSSLTGYALKTKLHEIISSKNINWHYGDLTEFYNKTDLDKYYDHDASNTTILLDIYSEIPNGPDVYEYTVANLTGSANAEGQGWNREHMMPQSTFNSNYPMYSDLFYVIPTDARINQLRSNYPYGIAKTTTAPFYTFTNGSRISANGTPGSGYTGRVYEPIDEFKGDIARSLLYFAVRYEGKLGLFNYYNGTSAANDRSPLDGTEEKAFEDWYLAMLLQWHNQDPVSQREIDRNNEVYALQKNRNPFIDYPQWVNAIWNQTANSLEPEAPTNLSITQTSAYFVNLSWTPSPDADVIGYKIYQNDV